MVDDTIVDGDMDGNQRCMHCHECSTEEIFLEANASDFLEILEELFHCYC